MVKYTLVVTGTDFGITDFLTALQKIFAFVVLETPKREPGRYEAQVHFSRQVNDEQLKNYLSQFHPYAGGSISDVENTAPVLASACCCEESVAL
ncbi:hypothetical protein IPH92_00245 [Candidatus Kaiserbacteria bacterium]|nr:MAG: hypothetical protein IPH92_00245 [Candidatus Kaiserbacteria bacterium]